MRTATVPDSRERLAKSERPVAILTHAAHPDAVAMLSEVCKVRAPFPSHSRVARHAVPYAPLDGDPRAVVALMVFMPDRVDREMIARFPLLRVIAGGPDNVHVDACSSRGVWLTVADDALTAPTAELALALMLAAARRVREGDALVREEARGGWRPGFHGFGLRGCTAGILGAGALGRELGRLLLALGAAPVFHDPHSQQVHGLPYLPLDTLMRCSRAVVAALPLSEGIHHLVDAAQLARMPQDAVLVNVGRGSTVDEQAVADALESGRLAAHAADVFAMEDVGLGTRPAGIARSLLEHPRCVFTPHLGSATAAARRAVETQAARSILQALRGERPEGAVNLPRTPSIAPLQESPC